jgi:hypothetical protein
VPLLCPNQTLPFATPGGNDFLQLLTEDIELSVVRQLCLCISAHEFTPGTALRPCGFSSA